MRAAAGEHVGTGTEGAIAGLVVIAGGGTAGHALPAVAIGQALVRRGHDPERLLFVGSRRGQERQLVTGAGFRFIGLPGRGIVRRLSPAAAMAAVALSAAVVRGVVLVGRRRPAVVLSVGGFASLPAAIGALVWRVPLILAESNAVAGAANRLVGRWARASAVAFAGSGLPREVVTGNPVRPEILAVDHTEVGRRSARDALGLPADGRVVLVTGGSLGARRINQATLALAEAWGDRDDVAIHHVVGERDWPEVSARRGALTHYQAVEYERRMPQALAAADLVVSRAGGTTTAELTVVGRPAILVPLPIAPDNHQTANARRLVDAGAAVVVPDADLTAERLAFEVDRLLGDPGCLAAMGAAAARLGRPDAADRVADLMAEHARG